MTGLCGQRNLPGSRKRERQSAEHDKVGVEPDALDSADAEHRQPVVMLQPSEFALDC
jgi:hypothetical protein